jgi:hypothetical protein
MKTFHVVFHSVDESLGVVLALELDNAPVRQRDDIKDGDFDNFCAHRM